MWKGDLPEGELASAFPNERLVAIAALVRVPNRKKSRLFMVRLSTVERKFVDFCRADIPVCRCRRLSSRHGLIADLKVR